MNKHKNIYFIILFLLLFTGIITSSVFAGTFNLISVSSTGEVGNRGSGVPSISADGRYIAFASLATNLVPNDTNDCTDIFVHDCLTGITERVSIASDGTQANNSSYEPVISADGRYIAFASLATNLVPNTSGFLNFFIHDRLTGITEVVSILSDGTQRNISRNDSSSLGYLSINDKGRYIAFTLGGSVFVRDRLKEITELVSVASDGTPGNRDSGTPSISGDGRYVAFFSYATNLVPNITNDKGNIFVHDRLTGITDCASKSSSGAIGNDYSLYPTISADGRYVAFWSIATNLVPNYSNYDNYIYIYDRLTKTIKWLSKALNGYYPIDMDTDGRYVTYNTGFNERPSVYIFDYSTEDIGLVDFPEYECHSPVISADGQYIAASAGNNTYVYDRGIVPQNPTNVIYTTPSDFINKGWNLISLPGYPLNGSPEVVFKGIDLQNASLQMWDNNSQTGGGYLTYNVNWTGWMSPGDCAWFRESENKIVSYEGLPNSNEDKVMEVGPNPNAPYWVMVGQTYDKSVSCYNIKFKVGNVTLGWEEAVSAGWIEPVAEGFDSATQSYFSVGPQSNPIARKYSFEPWNGYWLIVDTKEPMTITLKVFNPGKLDPGLEAAIRDNIKKPAGDLTVDDMKKVAWLIADKRNIQDLSGIEYCTSLRELYLDNNHITDLTPLKGLTQLLILGVANSNISDISPLSSLTNLETLGLGSNHITDITPLAGLVKLKWLGLWSNQISNIQPLSNLTNLNSLYLVNNKITDIGALVANSGIDLKDDVYLVGNPLDFSPNTKASQDLQSLISRGVNVHLQ